MEQPKGIGLEESKGGAGALVYKTKPYAHQEHCLRECGERKYFALLAEQGTGKTWIIINNCAQLYSKGEIDSVLVLAPNGVHTNWSRLELPRHMPDCCPYRTYTWTASVSKASRAELDAFMADRGPALKILLMNWEALQSKRGELVAQQYAEGGRKLMIICDESDAVKNPSAQRTKALMRLKKHSLYRRIMTGTPITNSPFDAFSQFSFLDPAILGTTSFYAFKATYAEMMHGGPLVEHIRARSGRTPQIVAKDKGGRPKYRNLDKLSALIAPHSFRVTKEECLDLPAKVYKTVFFDLTPEQRRVYDKLKKECRVILNGEATPFTKLVAIGKLCQVTSGYFIHPELDEPVRIEGKNPKLELAVDRIRRVVEDGHKIVVWARFRAEIADLAEALRDLRITEYHGGVETKDRQAAIDAFEVGDAQVFIANQQSGGTGITLNAASYVVYYSNNFSLRDRLQSEDRTHRIGQNKSVTYINLAASGTIDEVVIQALLNKQDVAEACLSGLAQSP